MPSPPPAIKEQLNHCWKMMLKAPRTTLKQLEELTLELPPYDKNYNTALLYKGCCLIYTGDYKQAISDLNAALARAVTDNHIEHIRRAYNLLGMAYKNIGEYGNALDALETSIDISTESGSDYGYISAQLNLTDLFYEAKDYETCERHLNELMGLDHSSCDEEAMSELYFHQAKMYLLHLDFQNAENALNTAIRFAEKIGYLLLIISALILKGRLFRLRGDLHRAKIILEEVISDPDFELTGNARLGAHVELAKTLLSDNKTESALSVIHQAFAIENDQSIHSTQHIQILELASKCYKEIGDIESTNYYLELMIEKERSAVNEGNRKALELGKARLQKETQQIKQEIIEKENYYLKVAQNQLVVINKIAIELAATLDLKTLTDRLYHLLSEYLDAHFIAISENDPINSKVIFRAIIDDGSTLPLYDISYNETDSKTIQAVIAKRPLSFKNSPSSKRRIGSNGLPPRSQLFLPLLNENKVIGVLSIQSAIENRFDGDEYKLILAITPFIALAFGNVLRHEKLQQLNSLLVEDKKEIIDAQQKIEFLALHDPLTELPNRRALNQYIDTAILKVQPEKPFSLAFIDLDGFKPVNDKHGHLIGDQVLKIVAERINGVLRKSDFSSRVGGDEFVVVIDHIEDPHQLKSMTDRILKCIEKPIGIEHKIINLSASIGVVEYKKHGENLDTLIHHADQAMYHIKRTKKGGVLIAK